MAGTVFAMNLKFVVTRTAIGSDAVSNSFIKRRSQVSTVRTSPDRKTRPETADQVSRQGEQDVREPSQVRPLQSLVRRSVGVAHEFVEKSDALKLQFPDERVFVFPWVRASFVTDEDSAPFRLS